MIVSISSNPTWGYQVCDLKQQPVLLDRLQPSIIWQNKALTSGTWKAEQRGGKLRWRTFSFKEKRDSKCLTLRVVHRWAIRQQHIAWWLHPPWVDKTSHFWSCWSHPGELASRVSQEPSTTDALTGRRNNVKCCIDQNLTQTEYITFTQHHQITGRLLCLEYFSSSYKKKEWFSVQWNILWFLLHSHTAPHMPEKTHTCWCQI